MVLMHGLETFTLQNRIEPSSWWGETRSHVCLCSFVWWARQAPLFPTERYMAFSALVKIPKQSQNLYINSWSTLHLAQGGRAGLSQVKELTDPSQWSAGLFVAALFLLGGSLNIPSYLTRLSLQSLWCSVIHGQCQIHNASWRQTLLSYLESGMAEKTEQGPSHIDLTGSQFLIMGILVTGGENPTLLD